MTLQDRLDILALLNDIKKVVKDNDIAIKKIDEFIIKHLSVNHEMYYSNNKRGMK